MLCCSAEFTPQSMVIKMQQLSNHKSLSMNLWCCLSFHTHSVVLYSNNINTLFLIVMGIFIDMNSSMNFSS